MGGVGGGGNDVCVCDMLVHVALALKQYIPSSLNRKVKKDGRSALNPRIEALLYQCVWRAHVIRSFSADEVLVQISALF